MRFEGASSVTLLRQKSRCSGLDPAGVSVFSDLMLTTILAAISKASLMCEIHDPACVYMRFEGASSAPLLRQKSRCSDLGPAGVSVFSDLLLTSILAAISKASLTCEIDACVYLRFEGASSAPLVRALILLVFRSFRICC